MAGAPLYIIGPGEGHAFHAGAFLPASAGFDGLVFPSLQLHAVAGASTPQLLVHGKHGAALAGAPSAETDSILTTHKARTPARPTAPEHGSDEDTDERDKGSAGDLRGLKEKNREAQRRFRARQKVLISGLKESMERMQTRVAKQEQELQCLRDENAVLRHLLSTAQHAAAAAAIAAASGSAAALKNNKNNNNNSPFHIYPMREAATSSNGTGHVINLCPSPGAAGDQGLALQHLDTAAAVPGLTVASGSSIYRHHVAGGGPGMSTLAQHPRLFLQPTVSHPSPTTVHGGGHADPHAQPQQQHSAGGTVTTGASS